MQSRMLVLIIVCVVSMLGLVSLGVPEPTATTSTVTFTSTQPVTATGLQPLTLTVFPEWGTVTVTSYPCIMETQVFPGMAWANLYCMTSVYSYNLQVYSPYSSTMTGYPPFTYVNFFETTSVTPYTQTSTLGLFSTTFENTWYWTLVGWATFTYSPAAFTETSVTTSTVTSSVTSSLTQTKYSTSQLSPILTNSTNQMLAVALAVVLVVSLLLVIRWRQHREKQATLTQFTSYSL